MPKPSYVLAAVLLLSACATTSTPIVSAKPAPSDHLLAFQSARGGNNNNVGTLVVTRDEGFLGSGCYHAVYINKVLAARLAAGEFARFYVEPGETLLRVGRDPYGRGLCGLDQDNWTQRETTLRRGEEKFFRLSIDQNGKPDILRSDI